MPPTLWAARWAARPDISARSVLVTIFGDTVVPVTSSLWLAQLFTLTDVFGFNRRLVRTSMFRLAAEGWLTNERVGRQSRYHLTPLAIEESEQAAKRIYSMQVSPWSGTWTLAVLDGPTASDEQWRNLADHLGWHGFINLGPGLLASAETTADRVKDLCAVIEPKVRVPLAAATFADLDDLVEDGFFASAFNLDELAEAYQGFLTRHSAVLEDDSFSNSVDPMTAFATRTMLIHDLRRIRLPTIDIPPELLPSPWIGHEALTKTAAAYHALSATAAPLLSELFETDYPAVPPDRFTHA